MTPVDQTIVSSLDGTIHGNCFPACLASLLDCSLEEVPPLQDMGEKYIQPFWDFLNQRGYDFDGSYVFNEARGRNWMHLNSVSQGIDRYFIVGGKSHRPHVTRGHACIMRDGNIVHDPHPSRAGILVVEMAWMITRQNKRVDQ